MGLEVWRSKLIASVDVMDRKVKVSGWQEETDIEIDTDIQKLMIDGFVHFTITDIDRDETLGEPAFDVNKEIIATFPSIKLNASGARAIEHFKINWL